MDDVERRAVGSVLGMAYGDALGAGYEFGPPLPHDAEVRMIGGGLGDFEPGEWTDDTAMAVPLLEVAAAGGRFDADDLDRVVGRWLEWSRTAKDIGDHTRAVLAASSARPDADGMLRASRRIAAETGRAAGNGSLMRTGPLALAFLDDELELVAAARRVSELTHAARDAADACVLWTVAIRHAVLTGELDLRTGLRHVREPRRSVWAGWLDEAEAIQPREVQNPGWVVGALQAAWSAITHGDGLVDVLERAVRGGGDTDTVAAIAGALIGAVEGAAPVPESWRRQVHGWPRWTAEDLAGLAVRAAASRDRRPARPEHALLAAVRLLHDRGYEGLRARPTFSGAGFWRCSLAVPVDGREHDVLRYSGGAQWDLFGEQGSGGPAPSTTVRALADELERRLPHVGAARVADPAYRFWFAAMLEQCGEAGLPFLAEDWSWPEQEGRLGLTGVRGTGLLADSFPLPPARPV